MLGPHGRIKPVCRMPSQRDLDDRRRQLHRHGEQEPGTIQTGFVRQRPKTSRSSRLHAAIRNAASEGPRAPKPTIDIAYGGGAAGGPREGQRQVEQPRDAEASAKNGSTSRGQASSKHRTRRSSARRQRGATRVPSARANVTRRGGGGVSSAAKANPNTPAAAPSSRRPAAAHPQPVVTGPPCGGTCRGGGAASGVGTASGVGRRALRFAGGRIVEVGRPVIEPRVVQLQQARSPDCLRLRPRPW